MKSFWRPSRKVIGMTGRGDAAGNVAVFLPNWIGDAVMATPALRALRRTCTKTDARLIGIMKPAIAELLSGEKFFDALWVAQTTGDERRTGRRDVIRRMREASIETAVLLTNSWRTAWWAWRGGAQRRIGYAQDARSPLLTDAIRRARWRGRRLPRSAVDDYADVVRVLGAFVDSLQVRLTLAEADFRAAEAAWRQWQWQDARVVALHPGAAFGAAKCWPLEHFAALARQLLAVSPVIRVLVLCGPGEEPAARQIEQLVASDRIRTVAEMGPSIALTKGSLARCQLLVTGDSGPRHIAAALGTPTLTLFGSTDPVWSDNYCRHDHWLQQNLPCRPCAARTCPLKHHRCLVDLRPEQVFQACQPFLAEKSSRRRVG